jgi:hypothetical protein
MTFSALCSPCRNPPLEYAMSRYVAPVGFTLACAWVLTLFLLASH